MTLLVVTLAEKSVEAMIARAASLDADLIELRLDALVWPDEKAIETLGAALGSHAIATLRPRWEGGAFRGGEHEREKLLRLAAARGFAYVDVEAKAAFADALARETRVILSRHDFERAPSKEDALAFVREAAHRGAWCAKLAVYFSGPDDATRMARAALAAHAEGLRYAIMGVNDAAFRFAAPALHCELVYAAPDEVSRAVPGQPVAADLRAALRAHHDRHSPWPRLIFLLGDPVAHSVSPRFQNAALVASHLPYTYVATRVAADHLATAVASLRALDALGANVTVPHKVAVMPLLDSLDGSARVAGAVNTVVNREGSLVGHNTDAPAAIAALAAAGFSFRGRALVLGAGGTGRALAGALVARGMTVVTTNRSPREGCEPWTDRDALAREASLVVNATTLGLGPNDASPLAEIGSDQAVLDAPYVAHGDTAFVRLARSRGCRVIVPGKEMLVRQGALSFALWTGIEPDLHVMRGALA